VSYITILADNGRQNRFMKGRRGRKGMGDEDED
jgi:hypothetical protein